MDKKVLQKLVKKGFSVRQISEEVGKSGSSVRYWLKKFNLKTNSIWYYENKVKREKTCPKCNKTKKIKDFYRRRGVEGGSVYCKPCTSEQSVNRQREFKLKCVEYKGGKCEKCGYNKYAGALEFHHKNPNKKDFNISRIKYTSWDDNLSVTKELDKCILVCANCHREIHGEVAQLGLEQVPSKH